VLKHSYEVLQYPLKLRNKKKIIIYKDNKNGMTRSSIKAPLKECSRRVIIVCLNISTVLQQILHYFCRINLPLPVAIWQNTLDGSNLGFTQLFVVASPSPILLRLL